MMGLLVELALSWLLLWLFEKKDLRALGIIPTKNRILLFFTGMLLTVLCCGLYFFLQTVISNSSWNVNTEFTMASFFSGFWWNLNSVLYEELLFRGALLYIAIEKLGVKKACFLSAFAFGIYHWFTMNAFGNWVMMAYLFIATGIWGYLFAMAFAKTRSIYTPIALHFGWNLINNLVFSQGGSGNQLLIPQIGRLFNTWENIAFFLFQVAVLPILIFCYLNWSQKKLTNFPKV